uniref:calcium-activated chloride channel regulator 1-like n=1 Tax=Ciona intestinalis TaxID=7719 RepID=UPI000EF54C05|nr:calcium-activated chloride channel regulator 1-like [Ciona intestinalis]|eukprot:XP_026695659.1 calcium-activated chloride channel regulator 1-like [Ciona intestinalis]
MNIEYAPPYNTRCAVNRSSLLPLTENCYFFPASRQPRGLNSSMMSFSYLHSVEAFCHNDPNEPINFHNSEADNEQNAKCNLKSLWEVIGASPDFREGANPPNPNLRNLTPTFRVVKPPQNRRFVVVLDVSGSMRGKRLLMMRQSTSEFISSLLSDGDKIGIVQFHSFAQTLLPIRHVNSQTDRFDICSRFPNRTGGSTCIGCGIQAAMQEMERDDPTEPCGHIVVLTDGMENRSPYTVDVSSRAVNRGCTIDAIFLTTTQNTALVQLVNRTSGRWFFAQDRDLRRLTGAFAVIADEDGDIRNLVSTILYRQHNLSAEQNANGTVEIDKTVGLNTTFRFSYQIKPPSIQLTDARGCIYLSLPIGVSGTCEGHPLAQTDKSLKFIQFVIPGKATVGTWKYAINSKYKDTVSLSVTSRTLENVQPIVVRTSTRSTSTRIAGPIVIEATVTHGDPGPPLLYLSVVAVIEKPDYTEERLILLDNGAGADNTINDGVYSRTFIGFRERGRYSIQVEVNGSMISTGSKTFGSPVALIFGILQNNGTVTGNREAGESLSNESNERGVFTRVQTGTGIEFIGPVTTAPSVRPDDLAPNRINDLTAVHVDPNDRNSGIRLSFTAPGDDADSGTATSYNVCYTLGNPNNLSTNFEENICPVTSIQPQIANTRETFTIPSPNITGMTGSIRIAIAIIASDEVPNNSSVSNIVILRFFIQPPIPKCPDPPTQSENSNRPTFSSTRIVVAGSSYYNNGTTATYRCKPGYVMAQRSQSTLICNFGRWSPSTPPVCISECPDPPTQSPNSNRPTFSSTRIVVAGSSYYNNGTTATYRCKPGYVMAQGSQSTLICNFGRWSPSTPPVCTSDCNGMDRSSRSQGTVMCKRCNGRRSLSECNRLSTLQRW